MGGRRIFALGRLHPVARPSPDRRIPKSWWADLTFFGLTPSGGLDQYFVAWLADALNTRETLFLMNESAPGFNPLTVFLAELIRRLETAPFEPFTIHMTDGRQFYVLAANSRGLRPTRR
jgi:hypothetical protein